MGNFELVKYLCENGVDIHVKNKNDWNGLMSACDLGNFEIVKYLVDKNAQINQKSKNGWNCLTIASANGYIDIVKYILLKLRKMDINIKTNDGWTALMHASSHGHIEIMKVLIEKKSKLNIRTKNGHSVLFIALENLQWEAAKLLINHGAKLNKKLDNFTIQRALDSHNLDMVKYAIHLTNGSLDQSDKDNEPPLIHAMRIEDEELTKFLIQSGCKLNVSFEGTKAIVYAVLKNYLDIVKMMMESKREKIDLNDMDPEYLNCTIAAKTPEMLELLVKYGIDLNQMCLKTNALVRACNEKKISIVRSLVQLGADIEARDQLSRTPLIASVMVNDLETVKYLVEQNCSINAQDRNGDHSLLTAINEGSIEIAKYLIYNGIDINLKQEDGQNSLMEAVEQKNHEIARILLENGAEKNEVLFDENALIMAILKKDLDMVKLLVDYGIDINFKSNGSNALMFAIPTNKVEIIQYLIKEGFDLNLCNDYGETPLIIASAYEKYEYLELIKLFLFHGGSLKEIDRKGISVYEKMKKCGGFDYFLDDYLSSIPCKIQEPDFIFSDNQKIEVLFESIKFDKIDIFKDILTTMDDLNVVDDDGNGIIYLSIFYKKMNFFDYLIDNESKRLNFEMKNKFGFSSIEIAMKKGNISVVQKLCTKLNIFKLDTSYKYTRNNKHIWDFLHKMRIYVLNIEDIKFRFK